MSLQSLSGSGYRIEKDTLGEVRVPEKALWGAQTQRAIENFPVSGLRLPVPMIRALALIKRYAAEVNAELGEIPQDIASAIITAGEEIYEGKWDDQFPVDLFQTGSGTSSNMNVNEVIANRACEILGKPWGSKAVHPNDHVNRGQSSNDVFPTALHIALRLELATLVDQLKALHESLIKKVEEFAGIIKLGRTHLQDAVPMTLGQEFSAYATQVLYGIQRIEGCYPRLEELALGGTAIGTGINAHPRFAPEVISRIARRTGVGFVPAKNYFEALSARDSAVEVMGALNTLAVSFMKIANDLRLLASGPRGGLGEIELPSLQPGSSIMPGKVNPVIPEMMIQVAAHVMGSHLSVTIGGQNAPLELNIMQPLIAYHTLFSTQILREGTRLLRERCIEGIRADAERCGYWVEWSLALVTPLALKIGYDRAAELAYRAVREKKTVRELLKETGILSQKEVEELLDPWSMVKLPKKEAK
jgi:fumarate hydratase class II